MKRCKTTTKWPGITKKILEVTTKTFKRLKTTTKRHNITSKKIKNNYKESKKE